MPDAIKPDAGSIDEWRKLIRDPKFLKEAHEEHEARLAPLRGTYKDGGPPDEDYLLEMLQEGRQHSRSD